MPKFLMVARDPAGAWEEFTRNASPAEIQAALSQYTQWSERTRAAGKLQMGQKLRDGQGRVVQPNGASVKVTDGPYLEGKEVVGGFWLLEASSYDEVLELSKNHPHLQHGSLEIREIEDMGQS